MASSSSTSGGSSPAKRATTATAQHVDVCFRALEAHLDGRRFSLPDSVAAAAGGGEESCALFVTWTTAKTDQLRGCIGNLSPIPLWSGLADYAVRAANDHRFAPISKSELPGLACGVSLLSQFERAGGWDDWVVGVHGLIIRTTVRGKSYSATYLPEVAKEQGWDHRKTIVSLLAKAGVSKHDVSEDLVENLDVTRYVSSKFKMTHAEWSRLA